jgi:hypothetical protein
MNPPPGNPPPAAARLSQACGPDYDKTAPFATNSASAPIASRLRRTVAESALCEGQRA